MLDKRGRIRTGLAVFIILIFILSISLCFTYPKLTGKVISKEYLEGLRLKANVECLQNSQCFEGYECVGNKCKSKEVINICKDVKLSNSVSSLRNGSSLNTDKRVLSAYDLPHLLVNGKIVEVDKGEVIEHLYSPAILIGNGKIETETEESKIKINPNSDIFTYRFSFSKNIDFSSKNIQGQVLRILGEEYVIGDDSNNSAIYLISDNKKITLEEGENVEVNDNLVRGTKVEIIRGEGGTGMFKIVFNMQDDDLGSIKKIKIGEDYIDPVFNSIKLSFKGVNTGLADVSIGGNCE